MYLNTQERWYHVTLLCKRYQGKEQEEVRGWNEKDLSEVNTWAVLEEKNELIAVQDVGG